MKKNFLILKIMLAVSILALIGFYIGQNPGANTPEEVTVGWIGPLTGTANLLGVDNLNSVKLGIDEYNSDRQNGEPKINLIFEDDQHDESKSLDSYNKMVSNGAKIIFMSTYDGVMLASSKADEDNVILVDPTNNDAVLSSLGNNLFLVAKRTKDIGHLLSNALIRDGKKNAFVLYYGSDLFMPRVAEKLKEVFEQSGGKATLVGYDPQLKNFSSLLSIGVSEGADAFVFLGYEATKLAAEQARDMGIKSGFYAANSLSGAEGLQFTLLTSLDGNIALANKFLNNFENKYGKKPAAEWTAMQAYDSINIVTNALRKSVRRSGNFVDNLRGQILDTKGFLGVSGTIDIGPDGASSGIFWSMYTLKDGKAVKE